MDVYGELAWRGMVYDATEGARDVLARETVTVYAGFDPTAPSLHVGSLLPIMALARMQRLGHSPIALVGGGTGLIGDPSGKSAERQLLTADQVAEHTAGIRGQLERFLDFGDAGCPARMVDNAEWLAKLGALEFMRDIGKHFTVNYLLAKESVKRRVEGADGLSYTEFSYLLLQAYDYLVLHDRFGCTLQIGGSDQWGNITAGMDLVRRLRGKKVHGLVLPLLTTATGAKFGKTEAGTIWLDANLTRPYEFYQFWLNADDRDAVTQLRFFTFLDAGRIAELEAASAREPERRHAQRALAQEVTRLVHGETAVREAEQSAEKLFKGDLRAMSERELLQVFSSVPSSEIPGRAEGWGIVEFLVANTVTASKSEAARLIRGGGLYLNGARVADDTHHVRPDDALAGSYFVVRKGKKDNFLVRVTPG